MKNTNKKGVTVLVSSQKGYKGTSSASSDQFARRDWCEFQDKHLFSRVELSKSLLKAFGPQKGPFYLSLGDWWKLLQPLKLPYYGQQVMRSVKQESYGLLLRFCLSLRYMGLQLYFFTFTLNYSRLPITRTFKWSRKRFELSGARRIWPGVRKKNSLHYTVNILITFNCRNVEWKLKDTFRL